MHHPRGWAFGRAVCGHEPGRSCGRRPGLRGEQPQRLGPGPAGAAGVHAAGAWQRCGESVIRFFGRRKGPATLKREFSLAAFAVWVGVTIRLFTSGNPEWIAAQAVNYGTLTTTIWLFITAAVGIQAWQNNQDAPPPAP